MLNIILQTPLTQDAIDFLNAFDRLAPDHVSGGQYRMQDIVRLHSNMLFVKLTENPENVDEWVAKVEEHYIAVERDVALHVAGQNEHLLTSHEYGLTRAA